MKRINWTGVSLLLLCLMTWQTQAESLGWSEYKQHFILPEGRVVDNGNNQISHSEGQGYGMILADVYDDKETFDQLWNWTKSHLQRQDNSLFSWRYDPQKHQVSDRNDATDGDVLIGWALTVLNTQTISTLIHRILSSLRGTISITTHTASNGKH